MINTKPLDSVLIKPAGPDGNLSCRYCFYLDKANLFSEDKVHRMSEAVLETTIKQVMRQAGRNVSFAWQGGEPTLMGLTFFEKIIEFQKQFGRGQTIGNGLQTNGILIDKQWAHFLDHNKYRVNRSGHSTWTRVVDSAKLMLDKGVAVNALTVVNDYSVQFPQEIYDFHKELGLTHMQFIPCLESDFEDPGQTASFSVSAEEYGDFLCRLFDLWMADFKYGTPTTSVRYFDAVFHNYVGLKAPIVLWYANAAFMSSLNITAMCILVIFLLTLLGILVMLFRLI